MHSWFYSSSKSAMGFLTSCTIRLCFVTLIVWLLDVSVEGKVTGKATCEDSGLGKRARVTCHYRENVVEARDVGVVSLLRDTGGKEVKVVECLRFNNDGFDCLPKDGYKLNGNISDQMIINIPEARPEHQGTYYCELTIQKSEYQMESCDLEYKESNDTTTSTPPPEQDSNDRLKGDTGTSALVLAVIVLFLVQLVITGFVVFLLFCRRHRRRRNRRQQETDAVKPGNEIDSLLPASKTNDGNGPRKMDFSRFPYNVPKDEHLRLHVSIKDGKLRCVAYRGSNTDLSQLDSETSGTDTPTVTAAPREPM